MKRLAHLSILFLVLLTVEPALTTPLVCQWQDVEITESIDADTLKNYHEKLSDECKYTKKMAKISAALSLTNRSLENLNYYQGLRYVDRYSYYHASKENTPLNVVFQIKKEDYNVPVAQRSQLVWNNWTNGINTISTQKNSLLAGQPFTLETLIAIHKSFYSFDESGEYGKVYVPGKIKPPNTQEISWPINQNLEKISANANSINQMYHDLGLQPALVASERPSFNQILNVDIEKKLLKPSHPIYIEAHLQNLAKFIDHMVQNMRARKPLIWNGRIFTPMEVALFAQQTIVRVHGFYDGNGRTSRYVQDLILTLFEMPFISSGNLQADDMTSLFEDYYQQATQTNNEQINKLQSCSDEDNQSFDCRAINSL